MKAIVVREFGPPGVMQLEDVPTPTPDPGEVLIEVHAVSVNRSLDCKTRAGTYSRPLPLPFTPGVDPSGVVVAVGEGVTHRKPGDRVTVALRAGEGNSGADALKILGHRAFGGYAQYTCVLAANTTIVPDGIDFPTATVVTRHAPMAWHMLQDHAKVEPGEWVLVMGAAGGLGSAGLQVAKYLGARVIAAAGSDERVATGLAFGADAGVNYRATDLTDEVMRITGGAGVNVVFENIGDPTTFPKAFAALARRGRLITAGGHGGGVVPLDVNRLYLNQITVMGRTGETQDGAAQSLKMAAEGRLKALIDCVLPLSEAVRAHEMVEGRGGLGKVVLDPTQV